MIEDVLPFLDKLNKDEKEIFNSGLHCRKFAKGQLIHYGSGDCSGMIYVDRGEIRVFMTSPEGREISLFRLGSGEVCVLSASCVLENIDFDVSIVAETETFVTELSTQNFARLKESNVYVELYSYKVATERFSDVMWAMQKILFTSFDKRLAEFLLDESKKNGALEIPLTHEKIAKYLGTAREVVSRMLKYFEKEGYVTLSKGVVYITNKEALTRLTEDRV